MARTTNKLNATTVKNLKEVGRHSDGGGLYLKVTEFGKRWVFMYTWDAKRVELGLGSAATVSLKDARATAQKYREMLDGENKQDPRTLRAEENAAPETFGEFALAFVEGKKAGWKNDKHVSQWYYTLSIRKSEDGKFTDDGFCVSIRDVPIADIDTDHVEKVLTPIWLTKPETAARLRGRIEAVLDAAKTKHKRTGENPARWRGHLKLILSDRKKLTRGHHAAMPFADVPTFTQTLIASPTISNSALAFTILTAGRSGEILGAVWDEIDMGEAVWRVPAERMKGGREHIVPLCNGALEIVRAMAGYRRPENDFVFPGQRGKGLSVMALTMVMRRLGVGQFTPHGFRSAFRDWAGDATSFARDDIELCLAHAIGNKTEAAYRRGRALEKRREIMNAWWKFVSGDDSNVAVFLQSSTGDAA